MDYHFLFEIAVILLSTKVLGILTKRFALPQVVGALLAGLLLGPAMLGVLQETTLMDQLAELGVIVLMFNAGLETDLGELKRSGKAAFVIALIGVLVPLAGGFALAAAFNRGPDAFLQNVFIGVVLTATSVSITVETLKEIGRLSTRSGSAILGAAIIDDVLGIIGLTVITSLGGGGANVWVVLGKIAAFFAVSVVVWMVMHRFVDWWFRRYSRDKRRFVVLSFAFCLLYSFFAEAVFGVADITGAYIAGLIFANTCRVAYLQDRFDTLSYALLSPIFFASIGLKVVLPEMSTTILLFAVLLVLWAVVSKVVGCGLGAKLCRYSNQDALRIGVGMISRGEVALIVANNGIAAGLMKEEFFGPVVLMVIATTILTPVLLKLVYRGKEHDYSDLQESELVNAYEDAAAFADAIVGAKAAIHCCPVCQNFSEGDGLCPVCQDPKRDTSVICVVADPKDVVAMERSREYQGLYHVLHGVISPMNHVGPDDLHIKSLVERVAAGGVQEVIMATNPDTEGEATAMYLSRLLRPFGVKITRLAYGIPVGSHLEYADDATLMRALEGRQEM